MALDPDPDDPLGACSLADLRGRTSAKWRSYPDDVLPAFVAEMDVPLAPAIVHAVTEALAIGDTGYPSGSDYAVALAGFALTRWGWDLAVEATMPVADVMHGILEVLDAVSSPVDAVVVNCPVYPPFYKMVGHTGRTIMEAPLGVDGRIDLDTLQSAFVLAAAHGPHPVFLLCSPHNPTGTVHTADELASVAHLAQAHGVRVVVDEIHAPVVGAGAAFVPFLAVPGTARAVTLLSASKAWNLAGLKAAVAVFGDEARDVRARIPEWVAYGPSHVGIIAHAAALRDGGGWLDGVLAGLDRNRRLLAHLLAEHLPGVVYRPQPGTYLAWLDCRALGLGDDPAAVFLERGRVALNSGPTFGTGGAGHARLNLATSPDILAEAICRMATALR